MGVVFRLFSAKDRVPELEVFKLRKKMNEISFDAAY
jgi:hypothetical protein